MIEVADAKARAARIARKPDLAGGECFSVGPPKNGKQNLSPQGWILRLPVDVEEMRVAAVTPAPEHVCPPWIIGYRSHVVGDDIDDEPHVLGPQRVDQSNERILAAELRIDTGRIDHVVSV